MSAQNPSDVVRLALLNRTDPNSVGQLVTLALRRRDFEVVEPALQRLLRNGLNPDFKFEVREYVQSD